MKNSNDISELLATQSRRSLTAVAVMLSMIVYAAALLYAGVRAYSLFAKTIDPSLLWLALVGIVTVEVTALALPLAIHYWTAPGTQRFAALAFYVIDLLVIMTNSLLDAAHHSGAILPKFFNSYGTFALPALPVLCMMGWALIWALDPASREEDARAAVRTATREAVFSQMIQAVKAADVKQAIVDASAYQARKIVHDTLGGEPGAQPAPHARQDAPAQPAALEVAPAPELPAPATVASQPASQPPIPELAEPIRARRNGHSKPAADPKA